MKAEFAQALHCPQCRTSLTLNAEEYRHGEVYCGTLHCDTCGVDYPIRRYIPRFVPQHNYSESWGVLWEHTGKFLRDSYTGFPIHENDLHGKYLDKKTITLTEIREGYSLFGFHWPRDLSGQRVLEIGPGTGNYTELLIKTGAELVSLDMSHAIDTLPESILTHPRFHAVQADVHQPVFDNASFDRIWMFQVLQHTPAPNETVKRTFELVRPGGIVSLTSYPGNRGPWFTHFTNKIPDDLAWRLLNRWLPPLVRIKYWLYQHVRPHWLARALLRFLDPVDPRNVYIGTMEGRSPTSLAAALWEENRDYEGLMSLVIINTFDAITPRYTNSANHDTVRKWLEQSGFTEIEMWGAAGVRATARRPE